MKAAYVEARYNPNFKVTKKDIDSLTQKVNLLFELTKRICNERFNEYTRKNEEESKWHTVITLKNNIFPDAENVCDMF